MKRDLHQLVETQQLYILKDQKPARAHNPLMWLEWMKTQPRAAEETTFASGRKMYTSFMGYSGDRRESQPLTFATAFMPEPSLPDFAVMLEWYYNWNEALAGHERLVSRFNDASTAFSTKQ